MKPKYIAIEGGEGSGKSTLLVALKEEFGSSIIVTREPGGSPYGEMIRDSVLKHPLAKQASPETLMCGMFMARFDSIRNTVCPALNSGKHVITDRSDASSYAYQVIASGMRQELELAFWNLRKLMKVIPDLYIFLDVDPVEGLRRRGNTTEINHIDELPLEFHERVRQGFLQFLPQTTRHIVIDANRPLEEVRVDFLDTIRREICG